MKTIAILLCLCLISCGERPPDMLIFGRGGDSIGLDPALESDGESFKVCDNLYETLVSYREESTDLQPALARSWEVSEDGLRWTFHLRTGVTFHDGTPFDADAVVFSLERQFVPDHPFHKVEGSYQYWKAMAMDDIVEDVVAGDDSTVVITLKGPNAPFLSNLAMNFCAIVSPAAVRKWGPDYFKHPCGTGPFRFFQWIKDDRIVLERNTEYWGGPPKIARLIFRSIPENAVRLLELQTGAIDGMDNVLPDFASEIRKRDELQLLTQPGMNVGYLAMNMDRPPFDDPRVRLAVNHAINKQAIADNLYQDLAVPATNPIPPMMWSYNEEIEPYPYDPDVARRLLSEAGFPDGLRATLWTMTIPRPYMPQPRKIAQAIQADLNAVGIRAEIVTWEWGTYLDKIQNGEHDMALLGWIGDNGDPDNFLYILLDRDAAVKPAQNIAFYRSAPLHDLLVRARRSTDLAERTYLYRRAQEIIHQDAPWVPLVHVAQTAAFKRSIRGFRLHPTGQKMFRNVEIGR